MRSWSTEDTMEVWELSREDGSEVTVTWVDDEAGLSTIARRNVCPSPT